MLQASTEEEPTMPLRRTLLTLCLMSLLSAGESTSYTIAVIPKGTTHDYWKSVLAGVRQAEAELNASGIRVKAIWKGPLKEDDRTAQIDVVQNFVTKGVSGIVISPLDASALVAPVEGAIAAGIPVVVIDSALKSDRIASYVATDNYAGGVIAAKQLAAMAGGSGKAVMLRYLTGSASSEDRETGFLAEMANHPGIQLLSTDQHAGATRESALNTSQNLIGRWRGGMTAVFSSNEPSTAGMALALQEAGLAGKVIHVGFDASAPLIKALREGRISALVVQDPCRMGYLGVKQCVAALRGEPVEKRIDTPVVLITRADLDRPEVQALIKPQGE
jgi:ribose transport system substrate-binding protein